MENNIVDLARRELSDKDVERLSGATGEDSGNTRRALNGMLPGVFAALLPHAATPAGASSLFGLIKTHEQEASTAPLSTERGAEAANRVFGDRTGSITSFFARHANVSGSSARSLLGFATPLALGVLGKEAHRTGAFHSAGIADLLRGQQQQIRASMPEGLAGMVGAGPVVPRAEIPPTDVRPDMSSRGREDVRAAEPEGPIAETSRARGDIPAVASRDVTASRVPKTPQMLAEPKHGGGGHRMLAIFGIAALAVAYILSHSIRHHHHVVTVAAAPHIAARAPNVAWGGGPVPSFNGYPPSQVGAGAAQAGQPVQPGNAASPNLNPQGPALGGGPIGAQPGAAGTMANAPLAAGTGTGTGAAASAGMADLSQYLSTHGGSAEPRRFEIPGLNFGTGSSDLTPEGRQAVDQLATALTVHPSAKVLLQGHTDTAGDPSNNTKLSDERAAAVRAALIRRGIDGSRISTTGHAERAPIASNASEQGRAANRRVDVIVLQR